MSPLPVSLPDNGTELENILARHEQRHQPLKKGTEAQIVWHNEQKKNKTPYAIVYLHGFKASHPEGRPVHQKVAQTLGCNLYLSRLYGHGLLRSQNLADLTPAKLIESAEDACRIGQKIGKKVILMGTSTGGSLTAYLAASPAYSSSIAALVLYSPLVHLYGLRSLLLEHSFSRNLLRIIPGKDYLISEPEPISAGEGNIWYHSYQLNGALALGETIQKIMRPSVVANVHCPAFIGYYYKNRRSHDRIVSTSAIKRMAHWFGTPDADIVLKNFPHANTHVICSSLLSHAVQDVISATTHFLTDKTGLKKT